MIRLYPHQDLAVSHAVQMLAERHNSMIVAGTGAGKTIMLSDTIRRFINGFKTENNRYPHTLVLAHRVEIHRQNLDKFGKVCPNIPTSEFTADRKSLRGLVHFAMVQTIVGKLDMLPKFDLVVIDEAHHSAADSYKKIIDHNGDAYLFGVSATPNRGDKLPLVELFDNFFQITTKYLIESHYLVRPKFIDLSLKFGDEIGHLAKNLTLETGGAAIGECVRLYLKNKEDGKAVIFAPNHEIAATITDELRRHGRKPAYLYANIADEARSMELDRFENGDADELINVDIATEGYDYPALRNVVDFDTNGSESQWIQKVGRGLRTAPNKLGCTVIDFGGNLLMYPDCEVSVNLEGAFKAERGHRLSEGDFFKQEKEVESLNAEFGKARESTPYSLPAGWESINDPEANIVYVACGRTHDAIVVKSGQEFTLWISDKDKIRKHCEGSFSECIGTGTTQMLKADPDFAEEQKSDRQISDIQVGRIAPKYSAMALNWYGANCVICWEAWRGEINGATTGN